MMDLGKLMADQEAMKRMGNTMVVWDLHTRKPKKILDAPGAPLEIRCAWGAHHDYCFTGTALTSKIWLIYEDRADGQWKAKAVADVGDASKIPLLADLSISADDKLLFADTWNDGVVRVFDVSDPHAPKQILEERIGAQLNMVSQSWDGKRLYFTSSLLANWDKKHSDEGELQFFKAYDWDGKKLTPRFTIDFLAEKLGAPHQMRFGAYALYGTPPPVDGEKLAANEPR
jgi:selenium-binding protein 1